MDVERAMQVRIAVADDDEDIRNLFVRLLEHLGHKVVFAASNGEELIDRCATDDVDLVLVDFDMPVMDGLAAAEHVRLKGIPVILVSGHPDAEQVVVEHEPLVARIAKPVTIDALQMAIKRALMA